MTEVKDTNVKKEKRNRLAETFTKEYKYEGLVLLVLAIIALILGVWLLGDGAAYLPDGSILKIGNGILFPVILIVLGVISIFLSVWPYYKPSISEVRRVTWPTKKKMLSNCLSVFVYTVAFAVFFHLADLLFLGLMDLLGL